MFRTFRPCSGAPTSTRMGGLFQIKDAPLTARAGVGYTLLGGRHVNDVILAPTNNVLNAWQPSATGSSRSGSTCTTCLG